MTNLTIDPDRVAAVKIYQQWTAVVTEDIDPGEVGKLNASGKAALASAAAPGNLRGVAIDKTRKPNAPITFVRKGIVDVGDALANLNFDDPVFISATPGKMADADTAINEVQTVTLTGTPEGGTFTLTYKGQTTGTIAYNASAATVQTALQALSTIGQGNVLVSGSAGGPYTVTFVNQLAGQDIEAMTADGSGLTGGTDPDATVETTTPGTEGVYVGYVYPGKAATGSTPDKLLFVDL